MSQTKITAVGRFIRKNACFIHAVFLLMFTEVFANESEETGLVRKEHNLSDAGSAPWKGPDHLIGIGQYGEQLMTVDVSDNIRQGRVFINGRKVNPFLAPMPRYLYVATYEFPGPVSQPLRRTDGYWEGSIADCLIYDGKLRDDECFGVENYLCHKWMSAVSLERQGTF